MIRVRGELGNHSGDNPSALTKLEVVATLIDAGIESGFWAVPEFEIACAGKTRRIDVVWARRESGRPERLWAPVAAFEVEGHGVLAARDSVHKNAESLSAAGDAGAIVLAMVLFQVGPDGKPWRPKRDLAETRNLLQSYLDELPSPHRDRVQVLLDEDLRQNITAWSRALIDQPTSETP